MSDTNACRYDTLPRDANGRFLPGQSGNPAGKKPGTRNRATVLREALADGEDIAAARIVIDKALAGNAVAARFIVDRLEPRPRGRAVSLDLPIGASADAVVAAYDTTLRAMASGEITPDEALAVTRVLDGRLRALKAAAREETTSEAARSRQRPCPLTVRSRRKAASRMATGSGRGEMVPSADRPTYDQYTPRPEPVEGHGFQNAIAAPSMGDFPTRLLHSACILQSPGALAGIPA